MGGFIMSKIILYSQPDCPPCEYAKQFLKNSGFTYIEKNIKTDHSAKRELMNRYNSFSTPTFVIDNEVVITGFDFDALKEALNILE